MSSCDPDKGLQPSLSPARLPTMDWTLCALCQTRTLERLQCPADNSRQKERSSYSTTAKTYKNLPVSDVPCHFQLTCHSLIKVMESMENSLKTRPSFIALADTKWITQYWKGTLLHFKLTQHSSWRRGIWARVYPHASQSVKKRAYQSDGKCWGFL